MATPDQINRCKAAADTGREVLHDAQELFRSQFPPGTSISWERGGHIQHGFVVSHYSYGSKLLVKNEATRTIYRVSHGDVFRAYSR